MFKFVPNTQDIQSKKRKTKDEPQNEKREDENKFHKTWNVENLMVVGQGAQYITYHQDLSAAFKEDCEMLLLEFATKECYTFRTFANLWRNLQFGQILEGELNVAHLIAFLENCFFQLKKYIMYSTNEFIQVGAFYMLYCMYFKQKSIFQKIRWTLDEYSAVLKLSEHVKNRCSEFSLILNELMLSNAFLFVAETRRWGIEPRYAYQEKQLIDNIFGHDMNYSRVKAKVFSEDYYGTTHLEKTYNEYQNGLTDYLNAHPEYQASSAFQTSTLIQDLKSICENFESKSALKQENTGESIFEKRLEIKNKAMKTENVSYLSQQLKKNFDN